MSSELLATSGSSTPDSGLRNHFIPIHLLTGNLPHLLLSEVVHSTTAIDRPQGNVSTKTYKELVCFTSITLTMSFSFRYYNEQLWNALLDLRPTTPNSAISIEFF